MLKWKVYLWVRSYYFPVNYQFFRIILRVSILIIISRNFSIQKYKILVYIRNSYCLKLYLDYLTYPVKSEYEHLVKGPLRMLCVMDIKYNWIFHEISFSKVFLQREGVYYNLSHSYVIWDINFTLIIYYL